MCASDGPQKEQDDQGEDKRLRVLSFPGWVISPMIRLARTKRNVILFCPAAGGGKGVRDVPLEVGWTRQRPTEFPFASEWEGGKGGCSMSQGDEMGIL